MLSIVIPKEKSEIFCLFKEKENVAWIITFALLGLLLCQYSFLEAINKSNSATATVLQSLNVIFMALLVSIYTRKKMNSSQILAIFLAVLGTYLIATKGSISRMVISIPGLFWGIVSAFGVVSYTLLSRNLIKKFGNILVSGWGMLIGGIVFGIVTKVWILPNNLDLMSISMIVVIVVIGTAVSFPLFLQGAKLIGPVKATLIACIEPVTATVLSSLLLNTKFDISELIGFAAIIATVFISILHKEE